MKKLLYFFSALALFSACEKAEDFDQPVQGGVASGADLPEVIYASIADGQNAQTRTNVDGNTVMWQPGDAISYFTGNLHNVKYVYNGDTPAANVELDKVDETGAEGNQIAYSRAIYPYDSEATVVYEEGIDKIHVTYLATQTYAANSFGPGANLMVATGDDSLDDLLSFRNACGYLVLKLYGNANIKNITLSSRSGEDKIAGPAFIVTDNKKLPVVTMSDEASTAVTLDCSNDGEGIALGADREHATEFWFALPPVTFSEGIRIVATDVNDKLFTKETTKSVAIERNTIQPMAALEFVADTPAANMIWYTKTPEAMAAEGGENPIAFYDNQTNPFDATIKSHTYDESRGKFVIEFSSLVKTIKKSAFRDSQIQTIEFPEGLVTIEQEAFRNTPITEITIPGSVNKVGADAFYDCEALTSVTFNPSPNKTSLSIGYTYSASSEYSPFYDSPLTYAYLNREIVFLDDDDEVSTPDEADEGIFYNKPLTDGVVIGEQVTTIPPYTFAKSGLTSITIPATVTSIGEQAFCESQIQTIELSEGLETIGKQAFRHTPITAITIPGSVNTIGVDAFYDCDNLSAVTFLPSSTDTPLHIGYQSFALTVYGPFYDSPLTSISLDRELIMTGGSNSYEYDPIEWSHGIFANEDWSNVESVSVTIGSQVRTISKYMFTKLRIQSLTIPGTVTSIRNYAFRDCKKLTTVTLGAQEIYREAFSGCDKLETLTIKGTVNSIGYAVFDDCTALKNVTFEESAASSSLTLNYQHDSTADEQGPFYDAPLQKIVWNRDISYYLANQGSAGGDDEGLFSGKSGLTSITIGKQVKSIPPYTFASSGLTSVTIPASVTSIGEYAFYNCGNLTSVTNNGTTSIGDYAFYNCDELASVTSNASLTSIGTTVFKDDNELTTFTVDGSVGVIGVSAFEDCDALETVNITGTVDKVCSYAFSDCDAITTLAIRANEVEDYAYEDMDGLTSATLYGATVGKGVFYDCDALQTVVIDGGVNSIGNDAFYSCGVLNSVTFEESTAAQPTTLTLGYQTHGTDEQGPFYDAPLVNVVWNRDISYTLADAGSADGDDEGLFSGKSGLTSVTIGEQVKSIPPYTFANSALPSVTIPANVGTIMGDAFRDCDALHTVIIESSANPIKIYTQTGDWGTFYDSPLSTIGLDREVNYVNAAGNAFTLDDWDEGVFANEEYDEDFTATVTLGSNVKTIWPYMFSGVRMQTLEIPASVTSIGHEAFDDCRLLRHVTCKGTTAPTLGEDAFDSCDVFPSKNSIAVPSGSLSDYKSKWSQYEGRIYGY